MNIFATTRGGEKNPLTIELYYAERGEIKCSAIIVVDRPKIPSNIEFGLEGISSGTGNRLILYLPIFKPLPKGAGENIL
jgi:hypothetical protein